MMDEEKAHSSSDVIGNFNHKKRSEPSRHFLSNASLSECEYHQLFDNAIELKYNMGPDLIPDRRTVVAMLFQKTSTRTRCSFEAAISELGHHAMYIDWKTSNFVLSSINDESHVLSRYCSLIVARLNSHEDLATMVAHSTVPVINGMCNRFHPCQAVGDFLTILEVFGGFSGLTFAYVGDGNNVCQSLAQMCAILAVPMRIATPTRYEMDTSVLRDLPYADYVQVGLSPPEAVAKASVVYTDTWVSIGMEHETAARTEAFKGFTIDENLFGLAGREAIFMHCLPAHRGHEVVDAVIDHPRSVVFEQAENRKHAQKALLRTFFAL